MYRSHFNVPASTSYLVGNSLGLQPRRTQPLVQRELQRWAELGVRGHFEGPTAWLPLEDTVERDLAAVVGARPNEVVAMLSLTANLHLLLQSLYPRELAQRTGRWGIVYEEQAFPSDYIALETFMGTHRHAHGADSVREHLHQVRILNGCRDADRATATAAFCERISALAEKSCLVVLGGVHYYTGELLDIESVTAHCRGLGLIVVWDLAHAAGNVPLRLHEWGVDGACWCSYKYLNSGPGGIGGFFVHARHHNAQTPRLAGWWAHQRSTRFAMDHRFEGDEAAAGAKAWQMSNVPVLSLVSLRASLDVFALAGADAVNAGVVEAIGERDGVTVFRLADRERAERVHFETSEAAPDADTVFEAAAERGLAGAGLLVAHARAQHLADLLLQKLAAAAEGCAPLQRSLSFVTPVLRERRGAQLSLLLPGLDVPVQEIEERLAAGDANGDRKVAVDYRRPDCLRVAPVGLYCAEGDLDCFVERLVELLSE